MSQPEQVVTVVPVKTAVFRALRWDDTEQAIDALMWMCAQFGWRFAAVHGDGDTHPGSVDVYGRNRKRYTAKHGDWIIALGQNGSIRVCSDKKFRADYREAAQ